MNNSIILSICIPTYNRSGYLESTINSIVNQSRFQNTNDVEIIISDNCSTDNTETVSMSFVDRYAGKIRYYRNETNLVDRNFEIALSYGRGSYLKLNNDTLVHKEESLNKILQTIDENKENKNILFFPNGALPVKGNFFCSDLNSFVEKVSYYSTWIGAFGIWKEDFDSIDDFSRSSHLQLIQVDVLFRMINIKKTVFVNNEKLCDSVPPKRGGYDIINVFMNNYMFLLNEQFNQKALSKKVFVSEKKKMLITFIRPWLIQNRMNPEIYVFEGKKSLERICKYFKNEKKTLIYFLTYYYLSLWYNYVKKIFAII